MIVSAMTGAVTERVCLLLPLTKAPA